MIFLNVFFKKKMIFDDVFFYKYFCFSRHEKNIFIFLQKEIIKKQKKLKKKHKFHHKIQMFFIKKQRNLNHKFNHIIQNKINKT